MPKRSVMSCARGDPPQTDSTIAPRRRRTVLMTASTSPLNTPGAPSGGVAAARTVRVVRVARGVRGERADGMAGKVPKLAAPFQQKFQKFILRGSAGVERRP